jgi:peptidoglycan-N-acetylglucosamine deacetylase
MIQFHRTPSFIKNWYPSLIWERPSTEAIYLTFDDGPHPEITTWVMDQMEKVNGKATFFCVGENIEKYPDVAKKLVEGGHRLGNHTFNHLKGWQTDNQEYVENVSRCDEEIALFQKDEKKLFRPPYGRIKKKQAHLLKDHYDIVMWSHLSWDFAKNLNVEKSIRKLKKVKPGNIIVFHDSPKSFENLKNILPEILSFYAEKGFRFETL